MIWGQPRKYQIVLTFEPWIARRHAEARQAAERVAQAIEQLACDVPDFEDMQLVELTCMTVLRFPDSQEEQT
jgi:hypothetical protein